MKRKINRNPKTIGELRKLVAAEAREAWDIYRSRAENKYRHAEWFQRYAGAMDWIKHKLKNIK